MQASWIKSSLILGVIFIILGVAAVFSLKVFSFNSLHLLLNAKLFIKKYGFIGVFFTTILAGTIIPLGSPALVTAAASFGLHPIHLALVATAGFTLGMGINYTLAYNLGERYVIKKMGENRFKEILRLWRRRGWILYIIFGFIPTLPIELLSLFCGFLKMRFSIFLVLTFIPRFIVFIILAYFGAKIFQS